MEFDQFIKELREIENILKESIQILIYETDGSPENQIKKAAQSDLQILRNYIDNLVNKKKNKWIIDY